MSQQPSQQPQIELNIDGVPTKVEAGTTGANIYADRKEVVAVKVDGQPGTWSVSYLLAPQ